MAVNLWSPSGDCHIALTSGHTFIVPGDKAGAEVPNMFRSAAIARGCIPVGMEPDENEPDAFGRTTTIFGASKRALVPFKARGHPTFQLSHRATQPSILRVLY